MSTYAPPQQWGPPVAERWGPPLVAPKRSFPWRVVSIVTAFVVLAALLATTAFVWRGAEGDLATSQDTLAVMTEDYEASQETIAGLETDVTALESEANGANIALASARACIAGLQDATSAVAGLAEDWFTFFGRLDDVRRVCQRVNSGLTGLV